MGFGLVASYLHTSAGSFLLRNFKIEVLGTPYPLVHDRWPLERAKVTKTEMGRWSSETPGNVRDGPTVFAKDAWEGIAGLRGTGLMPGT